MQVQTGQDSITVWQKVEEANCGSAYFIPSLPTKEKGLKPVHKLRGVFV